MASRPPLGLFQGKPGARHGALEELDGEGAAAPRKTDAHGQIVADDPPLAIGHGAMGREKGWR
jgi:hypothetical protein